MSGLYRSWRAVEAYREEGVLDEEAIGVEPGQEYVLCVMVRRVRVCSAERKV
jgi:hypothetical protein